MKKLCLAVMLLAALVLLGGCGCEHQWAAPDCDNPDTCALCGKTQGNPLGHLPAGAPWTEIDPVLAQQVTRSACSRCGSYDQARTDLASLVDPETGTFYFTAQQWTDRLQTLLGSKYQVKLESGITTVQRSGPVLTVRWDQTEGPVRRVPIWAPIDSNLYFRTVMGTCLMACDPTIADSKAGAKLHTAVLEDAQALLLPPDHRYEQGDLLYQADFSDAALDLMMYIITVYPKPAQ